MADRLQFRRDVTSNWADINPVLAAGEIAIDTTEARFKLGDGIHSWNDLPYSSATLKYDAERYLDLVDVTDISYDSSGNVKDETYKTGSKRLYTYDSDGNLSKEEFTTEDGSTVVLTITYGYDDNDNLKTITRSES